MNRQERAILRAEHGNTTTWLDEDGERRWLRARRVTPQIERMVEKGWLKPDRTEVEGTVFLVTKCGYKP